jgi:hypothetical protein
VRPTNVFSQAMYPAFLELPRVDAEVAVTHVERRLQVRE